MPKERPKEEKKGAKERPEESQKQPQEAPEKEAPKEEAEEKPEAPREEKGKGEKPAKGEHPGKEEKPKEGPERELVGIVRVLETDLPGNKRVGIAIRLIPGVSFTLGNALAGACPFSGKAVGELLEEEIKRLEDMIRNPGNYGIPPWVFNRRKDLNTGENMHLSASKLEFTHKMDIGMLKKIRCYRGVRHMQGLPVRGQRTRSSFRKSGRAVGVSRDKAMRSKQKKEGS